MEFKYSFVVLLASILLFSCKDNDPTDNSGKIEGTPSLANIVVKLDNADVSTSRAVTFPGNVPTDDENKVNNITIFVFNNQKILEHIETQDYMALDGIRAAKFEFSFSVNVGRHYFYAVANVPTTFFNYPTDNMLMDDFTKLVLDFDIDILTARGSSNITRGFLMTNKDGAVEQYINLVDDARENEVVIEIGRAVAKVSLAFDAPLDKQSGGELTNVEYLVDNNPRTMYLMKNYYGNALETPNFHDESVVEAHYQEPLDDYQPAITSNTAAANRTFTYCMENSNLVPKEGNTTVAIIKGTFIPEAQYLLAADGSVSGQATADGTFWRIATINSDGKKVYTNDYYSATPNQNLIDPQTQQIDEFPQGVCYYALWLKNDDSGNESKYTVKRNSYYKITITSVSGSGYPEPGDTIEPEIPLDKQAPIGASIFVSDWDEINSSEGI